MEDVLSNADPNPIFLNIDNAYKIPLKLDIVDEVPLQFEERGFTLKLNLKSRESKQHGYMLRPTERGVYSFGNLHAYASTFLGLVERRFTAESTQEVKVYPSFLKLRNHSIKGAPMRDSETGSLMVRRGASTEFDQIKEYIRGDDVRTINWRATARRSQLMVNTYMDEKSQQIICVIDKSRLMKMPFNDVTLLDYSINAALMFSYVALQKDDKVGLITFGKKVDTMMKPSKSRKQFNAIVESLYSQSTSFEESNYPELYHKVRRELGQRSLLFIFTNFETFVGFSRKLPYFKMLNKKHLLCVVLFENTELEQLQELKGSKLENIYVKTIADKYVFEKRQMIKELRKNGILALWSKPEELSVNVVNKYLELKNKRNI